MDPLLILLRIVHVGAAMIWFGGAIVSSFFLQPTVETLGAKAGPFMEHLMVRRKMGVLFPVVAGLTILSGAALYWRDSNGLNGAWITSATGLAFTIGGLAAIIAFVLGGILIGPGIAEQTAVRGELANSNGEPTPEQRDRLARAEGKLKLAGRIDLPLLILAALTMAVARYL
ncbi:MAG TPA: hypothetical protein VEW95_13240 [Candidatus Limnocylindrales bacterium]|nr:hypothetical protein [Candidatus Limnocylindrales bacterium]